jgi:hypothetical protein
VEKQMFHSLYIGQLMILRNFGQLKRNNIVHQ